MQRKLGARGEPGESVGSDKVGFFTEDAREGLLSGCDPDFNFQFLAGDGLLVNRADISPLCRSLENGKHLETQVVPGNRSTRSSPAFLFGTVTS